MLGIYEEVFGQAAPERSPQVHVTPHWLSVGSALLPRGAPSHDSPLGEEAREDLRLLHVQAPAMEVSGEIRVEHPSAEPVH